jgi:hypothetical protein
MERTMNLRHTVSTTLIGASLILACVAARPQSAPKEGLDRTELSSLSNLDLVLRLEWEHKLAESAALESDSNHFYDILVEEILVRQDVQFIPLLLLRVNDNTIIRPMPGVNPYLWPGKYDCPPLVRHKVRFILYKLLSETDYRELVGNAESEHYDITLPKARAYFEHNKTVISQRLKKVFFPIKDTDNQAEAPKVR